MGGHGQHLPLPKRLAVTGAVWSAYTSVIVFVSWLIHLPALAVIGVLGVKAMFTNSVYTHLHIKSYRKSLPHLRPKHKEYLAVILMLNVFIATSVYLISKFNI